MAGLVQHDNVEKVSGGLSEIVKELLLHWHSESGGLLDPAGFAITLRGKTMLVRFSLYGMISDEGNIKQTLRSKGAAGMRPCNRCCNIISKYHGTNLDIDAVMCIHLSRKRIGTFSRYWSTCTALTQNVAKQSLRLKKKSMVGIGHPLVCWQILWQGLCCHHRNAITIFFMCYFQMAFAMSKSHSFGTQSKGRLGLLCKTWSNLF